MKAVGLGIKFHVNISDEKLSEKIKSIESK